MLLDIPARMFMHTIKTVQKRKGVSEGGGHTVLDYLVFSGAVTDFVS